MSLVVTGISPNSDLTALEAALSAGGFPLEPLSLVEPSDVTSSTPTSGLVPDRMAGLDTGTGVPGLTNGPAIGFGARPFFRDETLSARLGDFEIPDDQLDNYLDALGAGRSVVAYFAKAESIDQIEGLFRTSGLANVKRF
jgi:hypothetical protein